MKLSLKIVNFYADLGIDGYRLDVINYISKNPGLPEGNPWVGELIGFTGIEHYFYGPHLHDYLQEIKCRTEFRQWLFGHMHVNQMFHWDRSCCIYEQISRLL